MVAWFLVYTGMGIVKYLIDFSIPLPFQPEYVEHSGKRNYYLWMLILWAWPYTLEETLDGMFRTKAGIQKNKKRIFDYIIRFNLADIMAKVEPIMQPPVNKDSLHAAVLMIAKSGDYYLDKEQLKMEGAVELMVGMIINKIRYEIPSYSFTSEDLWYVIKAVSSDLGLYDSTVHKQLKPPLVDTSPPAPEMANLPTVKAPSANPPPVPRAVEYYGEAKDRR